MGAATMSFSIFGGGGLEGDNRARMLDISTLALNGDANAPRIFIGPSGGFFYDMFPSEGTALGSMLKGLGERLRADGELPSWLSDMALDEAWLLATAGFEMRSCEVGMLCEVVGRESESDGLWDRILRHASETPGWVVK